MRNGFTGEVGTNTLLEQGDGLSHTASANIYQRESQLDGRNGGGDRFDLSFSQLLYVHAGQHKWRAILDSL